MFSVAAEWENELITVIKDKKSIDKAIMAFHRESLKRSGGKPHIGKHIFHVINENLNESVGTLTWALFEETKKPVLMVMTSDRNVVRIYDHKGNLVSRKR